MTHPPSRGSGNSSNEPDHRLGRLPRLVEHLEELGRVLLHGSSDLSDDDDTLGSGVLQQDFEGVDVGGSREGISSDSNDERLSESDSGGLVNGLVVEGSRTRDDSDLSRHVDMSGHDTHLATSRVDDTRAVRSNHPRLALALQSIHDLDLIELRDSLGDGDDESDLSLNGLEDSISGSGRRNVDDGSVGLGVLDGVLDGSENGETEMGGSSLLGVDTSNHLGSVVESSLRVESTGLSSETLDEDLGVGVDEKVLEGIVVVRRRLGSRERPSESRLGSRSER